MRQLVLAFALVFSTTSLASDPSPSWGAGWSANVWNTYCELQRRYSIPFRSDRSRRGIFRDTVFDQALMRFTVTTQTHGNVITADQLDILQFSLLIYPDVRPVPANQRILAANIGGFDVDAAANYPAGIQMIALDEDKSSILLQKFVDNEVVDFTLRFANGDERLFKIYPSGDRNFYVLAAMFRTCISQNRQ